MNNKLKTTSIDRFNDVDKHIKIIHQILISTICMGVLAVIVYKTNIPNPNMIMVTGLVIFSALFGTNGGIPAAIIMMVYTTFFFSENHSFVTYTDLNLRKVYVTLFGVTVITLFVCFLKKSENDAFDKIEFFSKELKDHNIKLQKSSITDHLTGTKNRLALRNDYTNYDNKNIHIMMIDVDDFKAINDTAGHESGDMVLKNIGQILIDIFGFEHSYRYGGDEFMIICDEINENEFKNKCNEMMNRISDLSVNNEKVTISAGYVYGYTKFNDDLRTMFSSADENLYQVKTNGKKEVIGTEFKSI